MSNPSIFISYAREDSAFAHTLANDLRAAQIDTWVDMAEIVAGEPWDKSIETALLGCSCVLVVLSPDSVVSDAVMNEVGFALDHGKKVIPAMYRACPVPLRLHRLERTDFTSEYGVGLAKLVRAVRPGAVVVGASSPMHGGEEGVQRVSGESADTPATVPASTEIPARRKSSRSMAKTLAVGASGGIISLIGLQLTHGQTAGGIGVGWIVALVLLAMLLWLAVGFVVVGRRHRIVGMIIGGGAVLWAWLSSFGPDAGLGHAAIVLGMPVIGIVGAFLALAVVAFWEGMTASSSGKRPKQ